MPESGAFTNGHLYEAKHAPLPEPSRAELECKQDYYVRPKRQNPRQQNPILYDKVRRKYYASPRVATGSWKPASALTRRTICDLATQIRFEKHTKQAERSMRNINPHFVTWLVGLPKGYFD